VKYRATATGRWSPTWCWQWACWRSSEGNSVDAKFVRHVIDTLVLPAVQSRAIEAPNH